MNNIYDYILRDSGDIVLKKCNNYANGYQIIDQPNGNILLKKIKTINKINEILKYDFTHSDIIKCKM